MLKLKHGSDLLVEIGGIKMMEEAQALFRARCDAQTQARLAGIRTADALIKIANAISMMAPDDVFVSTGSAEDLQAVRELSLKKGEEKALPMPGHTIHFDLPEEQGRVVDKTLYIVNPGEDTSVLAKSILRDQGLDYVRQTMTGIAKGKTLLIGFFNRGPVGAQAAIPAIEMTTSTYVMHSANILYRSIYPQFDAEVARAGDFFTNVHSEGANRPEDFPDMRVFMDRSWLTTYSMLCTYAGNTLLLKKGNHRFAVDLATYYRRERELSEHMFITGLMGPGGRKTFFAGAAPSGCGKTTTAMVGDDFIGDDLAQIWIAPDGTLRAVNPEKGIFGIIQDVNPEGDPLLIAALSEPGVEVIWSNVLITPGGEPRWVGDGKPAPEKGINYTGEWWAGKVDATGKAIPISNPNARCTLASNVIDNYNETLAEDPAGVPIRVITYSGRDSDTMPPVWVAKNPNHGVVIGASILSAATATEVGAQGVRRQPWANEPFIPGPLAEYMEAQFAFFNSPRLQPKPVMAGLNYFLTHGARGGEGKKLLGEKRDVKVWLGWLELYANGDVSAIETPIGYIPRYEDLERLFAGIGKAYPRELYDKQFAFYVDNILARISLQEEAYHKETGVPEALFEVYREQRQGLEALKATHGSIVSVEQLSLF
ncbi:MAG: phosphoenolpyruvate carboxykinase (GTP) [Anaerolineae bacterium]|nr:phosphoenolpyruvate carboxykinase (GTP) [Anaerolineae bacterium]